MISNKKKLDASDMKYKIKIMRKGTNVQDPVSGNWTQNNDFILCEPWAAINSLSGDEFWTAREKQQREVIVFKVFWCSALSDLDSKDWIVYGGKEYDIVYPDNLFNENNILKIKAVVRT